MPPQALPVIDEVPRFLARYVRAINTPVRSQGSMCNDLLCEDSQVYEYAQGIGVA